MELDPVIHQATRLRIMASLTSLTSDMDVDFSSLAQLLKLTDGNLGAHLQKLEKARYIKIDKTFVDRKPKTYVKATALGREAFEEHIAALKSIIGDG